jgi:hypothetical protein
MRCISDMSSGTSAPISAPTTTEVSSRAGV